MIVTGQIPSPWKTSPLWWRLAYPSGRCAALVRSYAGLCEGEGWDVHPDMARCWQCSRCGYLDPPYCRHILLVQAHLGLEEPA